MLVPHLLAFASASFVYVAMADLIPQMHRVIDEMSAAGLRHVRTIDEWPPDDRQPTCFLALFVKP